jgi:hypothetical protein
LQRTSLSGFCQKPIDYTRLNVEPLAGLIEYKERCRLLRRVFFNNGLSLKKDWSLRGKPAVRLKCAW